VDCRDDYDKELAVLWRTGRRHSLRCIKYDLT
jgi:hypothetical protein